MKKNLYIFDCFGVVIADVSTLFMNKHLNKAEQEYMRKVIFRAVDTGKITDDEMFTFVSDNYHLDKNEVIAEWRSYERTLADTVTLIKELKQQGHYVALLSNASQTYIDYLFGKFNLVDLFDATFVSSNYGVAKPDKEFYKLCVESFDEKFDKIYFTDDNPNNLVDLEQFGITPILFTSAQDFKKKAGIK